MAAKQAIVALKLCLSDVISHGHTESACQALTSLAKLKTNPYWLVKVHVYKLVYNTLKYVFLTNVGGAG